jgi:hypothetical protein
MSMYPGGGLLLLHHGVDGEVRDVSWQCSSGDSHPIFVETPLFCVSVSVLRCAP